jgi:antitoxin component HigA of HigAB toxin-antitoxin module
MRTATPAVRQKAIAHLKDVQDLRDLMDFNNLNVRQLADLCGNLGSRSTIGNLHSGYRTKVTVPLATRIARLLRVPSHHLFVIEMSHGDVAVGQKVRRAA